MKKKQYWKTHYESWKESGLTQIQYCEQERIGYSTFKSKIKMLRTSGVLEPAYNRQTESLTDQPCFEPVIVENENEPYCEIAISGAGRIIIEQPEGFQQLKELLR